MSQEAVKNSVAAEQLVVEGRLVVELRGPDGRLKDRRALKNVVTAAGKAHIADQLSGAPTQLPMSNMAVGSGTPVATALASELFRKALKAQTSVGALLTYVGHWDIDDHVSGVISEAGIFNSPNLGGTMLCSAIVSPSVTKAPDDTLDISWTLQLT